MARRALRFVGLLDGGDDLRGDGHAEVGGDERGFEFLERSAVSFGERVTMRLISCASLACVLARPALNLENKPMLAMKN